MSSPRRPIPQRILLVENLELARNHYEKMLKNAYPDVEIVPADNDSIARPILGDQRFDLVMTDLRLRDDNDPADTSGYALARDAVKDYQTPAIVITRDLPASLVRERDRDLHDGDHRALNFWEKTDNNNEILELERYVGAALRPNNVFIVHGHDHTLRDKVRDLVRQMGHEPIVLQEQPAAARTIYQMLTEYSNVGFTIVLATGDDEGRKRKQNPTDADSLEIRARQNVIFELGYFLGKYGEKRATIIKADDVIFPSDIENLNHIRVSDRNWRQALYRAVSAALPGTSNPFAR